MKRKTIFIHPSWDDENVKVFIIEFCKNFWGFLQVAEVEHNVLRGNAQMDLGPAKVGTFSQKNAPMLSGVFTIGFDPGKGKILKIEYLVDKGRFIKSKQILSRTYWGTIYKTFRKALENPFSNFVAQDFYESSGKDIADGITCDKCGKSLPSWTEFCTYCGAKQEIKEEEILGLLDSMSCTSCGELIPEDNEFCGKCGAKQEKKVEVLVSPEDTKPCISCGNLIPNSNEFCGKCGIKQEIKKVETIPAPDVKPCIKCGKTIPISDGFCTFCGGNQEEKKVETIPAPDVKPCIKCGKSITTSTKFCTFCGTWQELEKLYQ